MQIKKAIAVGLGTLMTGATLAFGAMGATDLKNVLAGDNVIKGDSSLIVLGDSANVKDVIGAVDISARLGGTVVTTSTVAGAATTTVDGTEKDTIPLNGSFNGSASANSFPGSGVLTTVHYGQLKSSTISWRSSDYNYHEQVSVAGVTMRHDLGTSNVNGTEKMQVRDGDIIYEYVFDKTVGGLGDTTTPNYTYPLKIKLLGKDFQIVSVGTGGSTTSVIKTLSGSIGTADANTPVVYGGYSVYATQGANTGGAQGTGWAKVVIKDKTGATVDTLYVDNGADAKTSTAANIEIRLTAIRVAGTSGDVSAADMVVGAVGATLKSYDSASDVTSTDTSTSDRFPGETKWGIQVVGFGTPGQINSGDKIQVVYKPSTTEYYVAGQNVPLPKTYGTYGEVGFEGFNIGKFATITVKPVAGVSVYNATLDTSSFGTMNGIEISSDVSGSIISTAGNSYDKAYVLFNKTYAGTISNGLMAVMVGYYDKVKGKILAKPTTAGNGVNPLYTNQEHASGVINTSMAYPFNYTFTVKYANVGEDSYPLVVNVNSTQLINNITLADVSMDFRAKTTPTVSNSQAPEFQLGASAATSEAGDVSVVTEGTNYTAGTKTQSIVTDNGMQLVDSNSNSAADKVVVMVPFKALKAKAYYGTLGAASTGVTTQTVVPVTSTVGKLAADVSATDKSNKNLVLVGGPCANTLTKTLLDKAWNVTDSCTTWSTKYQAGQGLIKVVEDAFATGKVAIIVAGTNAADTRAAATALQQNKVGTTALTGTEVVVSTASVTAA